MAVIGKLITRHFCLPLRFPLTIKKQRAYSILVPKLRFNHNLTLIQEIRNRPSLINKRLCMLKSNMEAMGSLSPLDPSSFSRPELTVIKHIDLKYNVDFVKKVLYGTAVLTFQVKDYIEDVILDTSDLTIESIELTDGTPLRYKLDEVVPNFGSKLTITLPQSAAPDQKDPLDVHWDPVIEAYIVTNKRIINFPNTSNFYLKDVNTILLTQVDSDAKIESTFEVPMAYTGFAYKPIAQHYLTEDLEETCGIGSNNSSCVYGKMISNNVPSIFFVRDNMFDIKIKYKSSPSATALQWLEPNQTSGKKLPYMFSQCQPIHARSILPCQDTPAVKFTYKTEVTAPPEFTVLMSAIRGDIRDNVTSFNQPVPIPSYLLAIAVAALESRSLGPRSNVWSEKEEIEQSAWEFAETETYLQAAERLCGPYQWTQYDLLVLPPSFPYGGMENPCLTFVTPTLLAGDRSQADVIVHEIMHSWTGNLVTNRNFEHFWLNEGFTVFLERKVGASLIPNEKEAKKSRDFQSLLGLQELGETIISTLGPDNPLTRLVPDLNSTHPDDSFSRVPYEKGSLFLRYLEDLLGGPAVFDEFLRSYLNTFQRKSLDTDQFKAYLLEYFKDNEKLLTVDWDTWLYTSGMPPIVPDYDTSMTKAVTSLLSKINEPNNVVDYEDIKTFTTHQVINLLQSLIDQDPLPLEKVRELGNAYRLNESKNTEIIYRWLRLCIRSKDEAKVSDSFGFVNRQGRMKYVRPIYRDLYAWEEVRERTVQNFLQNEPFMMHVSAYTIRKDLHLTQ